MNDTIRIQGARENNLKNIDITIPRDKLVVFTGLSGSGKSSAAFEMNGGTIEDGNVRDDALVLIVLQRGDEVDEGVLSVVARDGYQYSRLFHVLSFYMVLLYRQFLVFGLLLGHKKNTDLLRRVLLE